MAGGGGDGDTDDPLVRLLEAGLDVSDLSISEMVGRCSWARLARQPDKEDMCEYIYEQVTEERSWLGTERMASAGRRG